MNNLRNNKSYSFIFTGDIIFSKIDDEKIVSFVNPGESYLENISNVLYEDETLKLFEKSEKYNLEDYTYENGFILYKGDYVITSFKDYFDYWDMIHKNRNMKEPEMVHGIKKSFSQLRNLAVSFIGQNRQGITFWQIGRSIYVFNENGWISDYFKIPKKLNPSTMWALSPDGQLYALKTEFNDRNHKLLRINNKW